MFDMDIRKQQEISNIVAILAEIDLPDIELMTRDANTLLMRKRRAEAENNAQKAG